MSTRESVWMERVDRIGMFASAACLVHCLATPVIFSLLAVYAHFLPSEERTHRILALLVTVLGVAALLTGYRRHRRPSVLVLMIAGLLLIVGGAFFGDRLPSHRTEVLITLAGSNCMIAAHRFNHTFCRNCASCCVDLGRSRESPMKPRSWLR